MLTLDGEIDIAREPELERLSAAVVSAAPALVVLDLRLVTFAGSTLLDLITRMVEVLQPGGRVLLASAPASVRRMIDVTGLDAVTTSVSDAMPETSDTAGRTGDGEASNARVLKETGPVPP